MCAPLCGGWLAKIQIRFFWIMIERRTRGSRSGGCYGGWEGGFVMVRRRNENVDGSGKLFIVPRYHWFFISI